jgi:transcriptional regulator with PAS, ATPase and Fis domain
MFDSRVKPGMSSHSPHLPVDGAAFPPDDVIFGTSPDMGNVRKTLAKVAGTGVPVLMTGESGTGKEVIARLLHRESLVASRPFVQVNCAAIPATLLESELFGFKKGHSPGQ